MPIPHSQIGLRVSLALILALVLAGPGQAQDVSEITITPNYKEADIRQIIEAVGEVTGRNFIIDPRVNGNVTMLSSTPMSPDAFYEAFLSILEVYGFVAMKTGDITKILPNASAHQYPGFLGTDGAAADDIVTQVIQVQNVGAAQLVPILRPLIPQYGHLAAHPGSNMLIISDRALNVDRLMRIIRRIDQSNDEDIEIVPLLNASASEIVRVLTALTQAPRSDGLPVSTSLVADSRTNSVLIGGARSERLRLRVLIAHLDTPLEDGGDTQVRYLRYADSEEALRASLRLRPSDAACWHNLAMTLNRQRKLPEALETIQHALALRPLDGSSLQLRGTVLMNLHRLAEALKDLKRAAELYTRLTRYSGHLHTRLYAARTSHVCQSPDDSRQTRIRSLQAPPTLSSRHQ